MGNLVSVTQCSEQVGRLVASTTIRATTAGAAAATTTVSTAAGAAAAGATTAATTTTALAAEAVRAVDRTIAAGLEGYFCLLATLGTDGRVHLAFATVTTAAIAAPTIATAAVACSLAGRSARRATARGAEALGLIEFLLTLGEREGRAAIGASKGLVCHVSLTNSCWVKKDYPLDLSGGARTNRAGACGSFYLIRIVDGCLSIILLVPYYFRKRKFPHAHIFGIFSRCQPGVSQVAID